MSTLQIQKSISTCVEIYSHDRGYFIHGHISDVFLGIEVTDFVVSLDVRTQRTHLQTCIKSLHFLVKVLIFSPTPMLTPPSPPTHARTALQAPHALVLIWNIVGGAGPVEGSVNSSGATPAFERPKFPFLRSAAWAGSAVLQAFSRHRRPQRPC